MKTTECVLLLSGGIDSTTLLADLTAQGRRVHALSFDYGQRHSVELDFARDNARKYNVQVHQVLKIDYSRMAMGNALTDVDFTPGLESNPQNINSNYVPGRNLLMLSHAAAYAEAKELSEIFFAANADDGERFPDCNRQFFEGFNKLLQTCHNTANIQILTPYIDQSKSAVVQKSRLLGVDLESTISCYNPIGQNACGQCLSCRLREEAIDESLSKE